MARKNSVNGRSIMITRRVGKIVVLRLWIYKLAAPRGIVRFWYESYENCGPEGVASVTVWDSLFENLAEGDF